MASDKWQAASGKRQAASGKRQVASGKWQVTNGKWQVMHLRHEAIRTDRIEEVRRPKPLPQPHYNLERIPDANALHRACVPVW